MTMRSTPGPAEFGPVYTPRTDLSHLPLGVVQTFAYHGAIYATTLIYQHYHHHHVRTGRGEHDESTILWSFWDESDQEIGYWWVEYPTEVIVYAPIYRPWTARNIRGWKNKPSHLLIPLSESERTAGGLHPGVEVILE